MAVASKMPAGLAATTSALSGDEEALGQVLTLYQEAAYQAAYRVLGSEADARDAVQDASFLVVRALRGSGVARPEPEGFKPWLLRIVLNAALGQLRRRPSSAAVSVDSLVGAVPAPAHVEPPREAERREQRRDLVLALLALPERQRTALMLREIQALSYDEIAAKLSVSHAAVETLLFRARRSVRAAFERQAARPRPIGCPRLAVCISAVIDQELAPDAWHALETHLGRCPPCRREVGGRQTRRLRAVLVLLATRPTWDAAAVSAGGLTAGAVAAPVAPLATSAVLLAKLGGVVGAKAAAGLAAAGLVAATLVGPLADHAPADLATALAGWSPIHTSLGLEGRGIGDGASSTRLMVEVAEQGGPAAPPSTVSPAAPSGTSPSLEPAPPSSVPIATASSPPADAGSTVLVVGPVEAASLTTPAGLVPADRSERVEAARQSKPSREAEPAEMAASGRAESAPTELNPSADGSTSPGAVGGNQADPINPSTNRPRPETRPVSLPAPAPAARAGPRQPPAAAAVVSPEPAAPLPSDAGGGSAGPSEPPSKPDQEGDGSRPPSAADGGHPPNHGASVSQAAHEQHAAKAADSAAATSKNADSQPPGHADAPGEPPTNSPGGPGNASPGPHSEGAPNAEGAKPPKDQPGPPQANQPGANPASSEAQGPKNDPGPPQAQAPNANPGPPQGQPPKDQPGPPQGQPPQANPKPEPSQGQPKTEPNAPPKANQPAPKPAPKDPPKKSNAGPKK